MYNIIHNFICNLTIVLGTISLVCLSIDVVWNVDVQPMSLTILGTILIVFGMVCILAIPLCRK